MNKAAKSLIKVSRFKKAIEKLYMPNLGAELDGEYLLGCALLFLDEYSKTKDRFWFEFAYSIILNYSLQTKDYSPLYDFSCNGGFYPTAKFVQEQELYKHLTINDAITGYYIEGYRNNGYIETLEQNKVRNNILISQSKEICLVAPTSSGKSSIVSQHLQTHSRIQKAVVIVPSKSLISQTFVDLRKNVNNSKIINHESMYRGEERFVGALTQERTLRLLEKNKKLSLDCIYVDEAHNLFSNDPRNILLTRVIKICKDRNTSLKVIYLSPFICDAQKLILTGEQDIEEQRISYNIKEPAIYLLNNSGCIKRYDRFTETFFDFGQEENPLSYVIRFSKSKNFIFANSPKKIEQLAERLYSFATDVSGCDEIVAMQKVLAEKVHPQFNMIKLLQHGIVYLHARIPDQIKEYIEYQFKTNDKIKYLIANSVILEGINLPIDSLFVFDLWKMKSSRIMNLMGRVNRLNYVFDPQHGDLELLSPQIHFVESVFYKRRMDKKITELYTRDEDEVLNPFLKECNLNHLSKEKKQRELERNTDIVAQEEIYFSEVRTELEKLQQSLIVAGMEQLIDIGAENIKQIQSNLSTINDNDEVAQIVSDVFTKNVLIKDRSFARLKNPEAIKYYIFFIKALKRGTVRDLVDSQIAFIHKRKAEKKPYLYVGNIYGEEYGEKDYDKQKVYVDIRKKTPKELANLIIVKTKIEQDFISYQYNRAVNFLHDNNYIDDNKYNMEIYGTTDQDRIELLDTGISFELLGYLECNDQLKNLIYDDNGNIYANEELKRFSQDQDTYWRYMLSQYILFNI